MPGFSVNVQDLQAFAGLLGGPGGKPGNQQEAVDDASRYLARNATLPEATADSLFARVSVHHTDIYNAVRHGLQNADKAVGGSAGALLTVARTYRDVDAALAARIDATLPGVGRPDLPLGPARGVTGLPDAAKALTAPDVPDDYPDPSQPARELLDGISGATFAEHVVTELLGWNPYERYGVAFAGDWRAFARAGMAFGTVGVCLWDAADNIGSGIQAVGRSWQGNAADAAFGYFAGLANDLDTFGVNVNGLDQPYRELADSAFAASKGIADLLHALTDDVLIVIATVASGGTMEVAVKLLHILPEFVKHFLEKLDSAMGLAELLAGLAKNIQASSDLKQAAGYLYGSPMGSAPYQPPPQLAR